MLKKGFRLGRFFGIEVHIDWSLLFIFLLITWNLSNGFGSMHQNWNAVLIWATAILAAILFIASVLIHELAHSLVARNQGVPVRKITLFLFGGVSNIQREPPSPKAEFLITIAGPITSLLMGIIFIVISGIPMDVLISSAEENLDMVSGLSPLPTLLLWLGPINIVLGLFNLIPGFPLDGGRVVRSILWAITDNLRKATRWASYLGQLIAWVMVGMGIAMAFGIRVPIFGSGLISGLWLAFIGWFLHSAASSSYQQLVIRDLLEDVPVSRMMRMNAPVVPPNITVRVLVHEHIMRTDDHSFPVIELGKLVGLITLEDVRKVPRDAWDTTLIRDIMTPREELIVAEADEDAADALDKMRERDFRQLPVMRGPEIVGFLRRRDIIKWLQLYSDSIME
jgi:Zn-dependent protease/CBS domain-containing protein